MSFKSINNCDFRRHYPFFAEMFKKRDQRLNAPRELLVIIFPLIFIHISFFYY